VFPVDDLGGVVEVRTASFVVAHDGDGLVPAGDIQSLHHLWGIVGKGTGACRFFGVGVTGKEAFREADKGGLRLVGHFQALREALEVISLRTRIQTGSGQFSSVQSAVGRGSGTSLNWREAWEGVSGSASACPDHEAEAEDDGGHDQGGTPENDFALLLGELDTVVVFGFGGDADELFSVQDPVQAGGDEVSVNGQG
jgi:hypothetical protein